MDRGQGAAYGEVMTQDTAATRAMTEGGDARLHLDAKTGLNRYHSGPRPSDVLAYASSTANDISPDAFAHVERSEEHTSELQSLMRISYAVFCLKKKKK